jgi:hypothetical protein
MAFDATLLSGAALAMPARRASRSPSAVPGSAAYSVRNVVDGELDLDGPAAGQVVTGRSC